MGFDENYVFSLSNSDGDSKDEDCGLMVWNSNTLIIPSKDVGIKKNHFGKERNCIYPTLRADGPTYLYVLVVAEYMVNSPDLYTNFIRYVVLSDYSGVLTSPKALDAKIISQKFSITGSFNPSYEEWYTTATSATENLLLYYKWGDASATVWTLASHDVLHSFAHITGLNTEPGNLPVTGYYAGSASTV